MQTRLTTSGRTRLGLVLAAFAVLAVSSGVGWKAWQRWNDPAVILITVDTLRADRLSSYGYRNSRTPNIDRLADEGVRFSLAYCDIPWTTGSLASTLTGTFGPKHGVQSFTTRLPDDRTTLAEILKANGYDTGAVVGSFAVDAAFNLDQGFDTYDDSLDMPLFQVPGQKVEDIRVETDEFDVDNASIERKMHNNSYRSDKEVSTAAIKWLDEHSEGRFFLWVHYFGPHERLVFDKGVDLGRKVIEDYDPDLRETDVAIGRLLDNIDGRWGLARRTLVVLHSDHGQAMHEHGIFGHGHDLYEESVRIPILMRLPGVIPPGTVVDAMARNVDILSTALDYLDVKSPSGLDGRSLRPAINGENVSDVPAYMELIEADQFAVQMPPLGEYYGSSTWRGVRLGPWKYMRVSMVAPCVRNPARYAKGFVSINPSNPIGGELVPDADCSKPLRQDLYRTDGHAYLPETPVVNFVAGKPAIATDLGQRTMAIADAQRAKEELDLDDEQTDKLKSLGYLQ